MDHQQGRRARDEEVGGGRPLESVGALVLDTLLALHTAEELLRELARRLEL